MGSAENGVYKVTPEMRAEREKHRADAEVHKLRRLIAETGSRSLERESARRDRMIYSGSYPQTQRSRMGFGGSAGGAGPAAGGPAWAHADQVSIRTLRRDCQAVVRSNPIAGALVSMMQDLVVGTGPTLRAQSGDPDFNTKAETLWWDFFHGDGSVCGCRVDASGLGTGPTRLRQIVADCLTDGGALDIALEDGSFQPVETERLVSVPLKMLEALVVGAPQPPRMLTPGLMDQDWFTADGGVIGGMVLGPKGNIEAYVVGEYSGMGGGVGGVGGASWGWTGALENPKLVDAGAVLYVPAAALSRTNLYRPEPVLAACLERLEQLEGIASSVRGAFYIATLFGAIVTSETPGLDQMAAPGELVPRDSSDSASTISPNERQEILEPGMIKYMRKGEGVSQVKPEHPSTEYESYVMMELTQVAAHVGCPILLALGDPRQTNYSGYRAMLSIAHRKFRVWRFELETRWLNVMYGRFIRRMLAEGRLQAPRASAAAADGGGDQHQNGAMMLNHAWTWPPQPVLDPVAEIDAQSRAVAANLRTMQEAMAQMDGTDFDDELSAMARERRMMREAGLAPAYAGISPQATETGQGRGPGAEGPGSRGN